MGPLIRPGEEGRERGRLMADWLMVGGIALAIFLLSNVSGNRFPDHPSFLNPVVHALEFGLLAFFLTRAIFRTRRESSGSLLQVALSATFCLIYGVFDEIHQLFVPQRVFDPWDVVFDLVGTMAGIYLFLRLSPREGKGAGAGTCEGREAGTDGR